MTNKSSDLFSAILNLSIPKINKYFKMGGEINVKSPTGKSPLSELVTLLISNNEKLLHESSPTSDLSSFQDNVCKIGCILITQGCSYNSRASQTSRSIFINQLMLSRFPKIHEEWNSLHQRNLIMGSVNNQLEKRASEPSKKRKI